MERPNPEDDQSPQSPDEQAYDKSQSRGKEEARLSTRLCEKKGFLKGLIFKKKGFCNKKKGFPCQMDSFLIPAKGFFTSCILK